MIENDADREAMLTEWLRRYAHCAHVWQVLGAILDADDLLILDLRCEACGGDPMGDGGCVFCLSTGRRDVRVVDADLAAADGARHPRGQAANVADGRRVVQ